MNKNLKIIFALTITIATICLYMLTRAESRLVIDINGFDTSDATYLSVGEQSDICYDKIPTDYITISWDNNRNTYTWQINDRYIAADSLYYYKINDFNPNSYVIDKDAVIHTSNGDKELTITYDELKNALKGIDNKYVLLSNIIQKVVKDSTTRDTKSIKSFVYNDKGTWRIIILDMQTSLHTSKGATLAYCTQGTTAEYTPQQSEYCKVQFFNVKSNAFRLEHKDKSTFALGDINHTMKPMIVTTEWGAGHIMLHHTPGTTHVLFPKSITYAERLDTLFTTATANSAMLTMQQFNGSLPFSQNIYIPQFSTAISQDILNLRQIGDSILLNENLLRSQWHLLPQMNTFTIGKGTSNVHLRAGFIDTPFILSYLWLTLAIFAILFIIYPYLTDTKKVLGSAGIDTWASYLPQYFRVVITIALTYCLCKTMIAFKLSYTYPYFEKLTGVIVVCTALTLLLVFHLSLIINHNYLTVAYKRRANGKQRKWVAVAIGGACLMLCVAAFAEMDKVYSANLLSAYLPGETTSLNPIHWVESIAINDLHRSIPFMLFLANAAALAVLCILNIVRSFDFKWWNLQQSITSWSNRHESREHLRIERMQTHTELKRILNHITTITFFLLQYAAFPCLIIIGISLTPGNFATAFITLGVIIGYSYTLSCINFEQKRFVVFCEMLATSIVYLIAAIAFGDKGYLTNYFGFFLTFILMYFLMLKSKSAYSQVADERRAEIREQKAIPYIAVIALLVAIALPWFIGLIKNPEKVSYDRTDRRISMFAQYDDYLNSGYRYAVSDVEFMTVMMHSMFVTEGSDPLNNETHALHPSVSTGQSPVVLNDLSLPCAFIGGYGWMAYIPYFGLLAILTFTVLYYSLRPTLHQHDMIYLDMRSQWRILTMFMWVGTTLYLYLSYIGQIPFTGRLNPGLGVDSVGEALETSILLAFMTATTLYHKKRSATTQQI